MKKHVWGGTEMPDHIDNIKTWTQQVDDKLIWEMQATVEKLYRRTYGIHRKLSEDEEDVVNSVARETLDRFYDIARDNYIEVWHPTADSYEF